MSTIFSLFMVLIIIACVLLIIVIMAQNPKGGGLSGTFGVHLLLLSEYREPMNLWIRLHGHQEFYHCSDYVECYSYRKTINSNSSVTTNKKELPNNPQAPVQKPTAQAPQTQQSSAPAQTAKQIDLIVQFRRNCLLGLLRVFKQFFFIRTIFCCNNGAGTKLGIKQKVRLIWKIPFPL